MNDEALNQSVRQFLKQVGVNSQREIEKAVANAIATKAVSGNEAFPASVVLRVQGLELEVKFEGEIRLG